MSDAEGGSRPERMAQAARLMRLASYASISVAGTLILVKAAAWLATGSVAMLSSLVDSMLDAGASLVNLLAIRQALMPPDAEHRFGHGKAESLAGLVQTAFIGGSAVFLLLQGIGRLLAPVPVEQGGFGVAVMLFSIVLTFALVCFQRIVVRRSGSLAVGADSMHYLSDLLSNLAVIAALVLAGVFGWTIADPLFAIAVALFILHGAWEVLRQAYDQLMDRELPEETRERIRVMVMRHPEVRALHDLRTRASGTTTFVQLHIELDGQLSLIDAHGIADAVETDLRAAFPGAEVIVHQDPSGINEERPSFAGS